MDKYEYKIRAEEIKTLISQKKYIEAAKVADTIDWTRVKSVMMLCTVSDVYKVNRRFEDAKLLLEMANERHPSGRMIIYSLCDLSIKMGEVVSAIKYYKEFEQVAPNDSGKYVLQYKLYEAQDVGLEERIAVLEELKKRDYREKWAYELAYLYHRVGLATKCVEECDELILWFGDGKYVMKAMELKTLHQPLTPSQQKKFDAYMMRKQGLNVPKELLEEQNDSNKKKKAAAGNGAAGQADSDMDIQVKTMDVGKYNTMNLQKELAESMRELMHNGSGSKEPVSIQDYRRYQEQAYAQETYAEETYPQETYSQEAYSQEAYPEETYPQDAYSQGTYQEEGYTAEAYTDPGVYGQSPEQMGENGYDPAAGYDGPADYNASAAYGTAYGYDNTAGHEAAPAYTEPERAETQAPYVNRQQEEDGYENYLSQEYDGQISLVVPEEHPVEKQITGQMNIEDIMREWERMKRENEEKRRQQLEQRVKEQTGALFRDFDETSRKGMLERLQKEERIPVDRRTRQGGTRQGAGEIPEHTKIWAASEVENAIRSGAGRVNTSAGAAVSAETAGSGAAVPGTVEVPAGSAVQEAVERTAPERPMERSEERPAASEQAKPVSLPSMEQETKEDSAPVIEVPDAAETGIPSAQQEEKRPEAGMTELSAALPEEREAQREKEEVQAPAAEPKAEPVRQEMEEAVPEPEPHEPSEDVQVRKEPIPVRSEGRKEEPAADEEENSWQEEQLEAQIRSMSAEEKRLFSSFVPTKGAMKKLVQALDKLSLAAYTGNLILTGDPGADTLDLAKNIIKDVRAKDRNFSGKLAKIKGSALNSSKKEASELIEQLSGGALLIEGAGKINGESMKKLLLALNQERWGILVILMDTKRNMNKLIAANQGMSSFFNARFDLEALDNSTLVAYGCQYARMQEYAIDELGRLALHTRIEDMQTIDHVVTVRDVREIVDEAIDHANRKTPKHFVDVLFARRYDDDDMIILHEGDFI